MEHNNKWEPLVLFNISFCGRISILFTTRSKLKQYWFQNQIICDCEKRWQRPWKCCHGGTVWPCTWLREICPASHTRALARNTGAWQSNMSRLGNKEHRRQTKRRRDQIIMIMAQIWYIFRSYIDKPVSLGRKFHLIIGEFVTRDHRFANCCLIVLFCSIRWRESESGCGRDGEKAKASSAWWKVLSFFHLVVCLLKKNKSFFCPIFIVCLFAE